MKEIFNITFTCCASITQQVFLHADFLNWVPISMQDVNGNGIFKSSHKLSPGKYFYFYTVNSEVRLDRNDPTEKISSDAICSCRTVYPSYAKAAKKKAGFLPDMDNVLQECCIAGQTGYRNALQNLKYLSNAIGSIAAGVEQISRVDILEQTTETTQKNIREQLDGIKQKFQSLPDMIYRELEKLKNNHEAFNIVIFGKTMNGKSTMMEIFTRGNGDSIGHGAQRTTRDVRSYSWNGIKITDVPGICASGGEDDSEVAYEATKNADLVIFLITDDAPGNEEAVFFEKIRSQGKPIIGVINVRCKIKTGTTEDIEDFIEDLNRKMSNDHCANVEKQFNEFLRAKSSGPLVRFIPVHLKARFLSEQQTDPAVRKQLEQISNFRAVEKAIVNTIKRNGPTYRLKSFMDLIVKPLQDFSENLFEQNEQCRQQGLTLDNKRKELECWQKEDFSAFAATEIKAFVSRCLQNLRNKIPDFCENYCESSNAQVAWNKLVQSYDIEGKTQSFCKNTLLKNLQDKLKSVQQELEIESTFFFKTDCNFSTPPSDYKKMWNWGGGVLGFGLTIAALWWNPLGWAALGVGVLTWVGSLFFDDYEKKLNRARAQMQKQLYEQLNDVEKNLKNQLFSFLENKLIGYPPENYLSLNEKLNLALFNLQSIRHPFATNNSAQKSSGIFRQVIESMHSTSRVIFSLADHQRKLGGELNQQIRELNCKVIEEILLRNNFGSSCSCIDCIGRIPGKITMLVLKRNTILPNELKKTLGQALKETILFVPTGNNTYFQICNILGIRGDCNVLRLDEKKNIAVLKQGKETPEFYDRIRLAQQITGTCIRYRKE